MAVETPQALEASTGARVRSMAGLLGQGVVEHSGVALDWGFWAWPEWSSLPGRATNRHWQEGPYYCNFDYWQQPGWQSYGPLRAPDRKDVEKPEKYSGDITEWLRWSKSFTRFFRRHDWRWSGLLEKVHGVAG